MDDLPATSGISSIILAGGRSSRFGSDKATARLADDKITFLERAITLASSISSDVLVAGEPRSDTYPQEPVRWVPDTQPHQGPLAGLISTLPFRRFDRCIVLAVDQPLVTHGHLTLLMESAVPKMPTCFKSGERIEVLPLYLPSRDAMAGITDQYGRGIRSLWKALDATGLTVVRANSKTAFALQDVDSPEDFSRVGGPIVPQ
jgi:molybdopterin-guanine dinucleotide biosynthesis protein A